MPFGALITSGDDNRSLPDDLMASLVEVRVEQSLDRPTRFALRFEEDYDETGEPLMAEAEELGPERIISIAVPEGEGEGDGWRCLVRGAVTEIRSSFAHGGPGSSFEAHGMDRRVEMSRRCVHRAWTGRASDAAQSILSGYGMETDLQETTRDYTAENGTLNQRGTDLDFLNRIARQNNLCFWISYQCRSNSLDPSGGTLEVEETAHLASSPPRGEGFLSEVPPPALKLVPDTEVCLRVNPPQSTDRTVSRFDLHLQVERPTSFEGQAVDVRAARIDSTSARDTQPPILDGGRTLDDIAPAERLLWLSTAGGQLELRNQAEAALTEAGWMLTATAETTAHLLDGVLEPHEVIAVENAGTRHSGPYQVSGVTHTITGAEHRMEVQLRRNAVGG